MGSLPKTNTKAVLFFLLAFMLGIQSGEAGKSSPEDIHNCRIEQLRPTKACPKVTHSPEDCLDQTDGEKGTRIPLEDSYIHYMKGGFAYLVSGGSSVDIRDLVFLGGCTWGFDDRKPEESPDYLGHAWVDDSDPYPQGKITGDKLLKEMSEHFKDSTSEPTNKKIAPESAKPPFKMWLTSPEYNGGKRTSNGEIKITSIVDELIIEKVVANRGNCPVSHNFVYTLFDMAASNLKGTPEEVRQSQSKPARLKFGETHYYSKGCENEDVLELEVFTNYGRHVVNF